MPPVDPVHFFAGRVVLVAPHMDDEVLACGGLLAKLTDKRQIHLIYATDGMKSPAPILPGRDFVSPDLGELRVRESRAAMSVLGVPEENLHFLRLPEARLQRHLPALEEAVRSIVAQVEPRYLFVPFRYDRHPDHIAVNHVVTAGASQGWLRAQLVEYFVYYRWRLLPGRDIRRYIHARHLVEVDIHAVAQQKKAALECFRSQTTLHYPWQTRPILTPQLLAEECRHAEIFLMHAPGVRGASVFMRAVLWIRLAHRLEPSLQKWKYLAVALLRRSLRLNARNAASA